MVGSRVAYDSSPSPSPIGPDSVCAGSEPDFFNHGWAHVIKVAYGHACWNLMPV